MRMEALTPAIKMYLERVLEQYHQGKLTPTEETSLFQDIYDSGMYIQQDEIIRLKIRRLLDEGKIQKRGTP